uniref:RING-type domain-containing protein n=1 Tax=Oncorhynchus mykiss TaxID=8022 RepID=A0A8C7PB34_ONCMY
MAEAGVMEMISEQVLTCSICLDLFNNPVSTPCGHNFCQGCIGGYVASSSTCTCPLCKHQFPERPQLNINRVFAHIADSWRPGERFAAAPCPLHHRLLEVYCRTDQICICVLEEHRTVSVQTESKLIGKTELEILNRVEGKRLRLNELRSRLETVGNYARGELSEVEQLLGELSCSVDRIRDELVGGMEEKQASVETRGEGRVTHLEAELSQLLVRRSRLEAQVTSDDHICFLQVWREYSDTQELDAEAEVSLHFSLGEGKVVLGELKKSMAQIRMGEVHSRVSITSLRESDSTTSFLCVFSSQVNVGENKDWKVGVVWESSQRKGLFDMSPNSGYYALWWGCTHLRALTKVKASVRLPRVDVFLDCEEGQVTFYNIKTSSSVYRFSVAEFSERTFPLLGTGRCPWLSRSQCA